MPRYVCGVMCAQRVDVLHRVSGSIEVVRDILGRSGTLYVTCNETPDRTVVDRFTEAAKALALVAEALEGEFQAS